jgi:hypothetical protein
MRQILHLLVWENSFENAIFCLSFALREQKAHWINRNPWENISTYYHDFEQAFFLSVSLSSLRDKCPVDCINMSLKNLNEIKKTNWNTRSLVWNAKLDQLLFTYPNPLKKVGKVWIGTIMIFFEIFGPKNGTSQL